MNNIVSKFSLYEVLRLIVPGFYVTTVLYIVLVPSLAGINEELGYLNLTLFIFASLVMGTLIYTLNFPRWLRSWEKELPSVKIKKRHKEVDSVVVDAVFFSSYDTMPQGLRQRVELYSSFYFFSVTIAYCSLILTVVMAYRLWESGNAEEFLFYLLLQMGLCFGSAISAYRIFHEKLKGLYARQLYLFYRSPEYYQFWRMYVWGK